MPTQPALDLPAVRLGRAAFRRLPTALAAACLALLAHGALADCREDLEKSMSSTLAAASTDTDFTLLLEAADGRLYRHSRGVSTGATLYESASTSKLVSAVVILALVERGYLSLDSKPQELLWFWNPPAGSPASRVSLRHLLSFTSGFWDEPPCLDLAGSGFEQCVQSIYFRNAAYGIEPGSEYYYSSTHLQIAGLMAIKARGFASWADLFEEFKSRTGLFEHSRYDLPSATNPRLAGGMRWTGDDYLALLRELYRARLLSADTQAALWSDQRGAASVLNSPSLSAIGQDWAYGLGNWLECPSPEFTCRAWPRRNSSPGAYGAYPFVDFGNGYFGLLARQGALGTFARGWELYQLVHETATQWARKSCD